MNKYNNIFNDNNDDKKTNIKINKMNLGNEEKNNSIKIKEEGFRKSNMSQQNSIKYKNYNTNKEYINIPRLLIMSKNNNQNGNKEIKIYSKNNIKSNGQEKLYNKTNNIIYSKNGKTNLRNFYPISQESDKNNKEEFIKKEFNELFENIDDSTNNYQKYEDEYTLENGDEIKKINIRGVNYKLSGNGPEKINISEEIELNNIDDKNNIIIINDNPKNKSNMTHQKIIIKKNIGNTGEENNLVQKIEKDIKTSKMLSTNINIPKHVFKSIEDEEKLKQLIKYNEEDNYNNLYGISFFKEKEIYGMNPFENFSPKKLEKNNNNTSKHKPYNERRKLRMKNKLAKNNKKNYDYKINEENNNKENKSIENFKEKKIIKDNTLTEKKIVQEIKKEEKFNTKDYKYDTNIIRNTKLDENNKKDNNNIKQNRIHFNKNINIKFNEIKKYDINDDVKNEESNAYIPRVKKKRFHRVIHSEL